MALPPGPWTVKTKKTEVGRYYTIVDATGDEVAEIYDDDRKRARLIAAAPELLSTLTDVLAMLDGEKPLDTAAARAAIAKATGK